MFFEKKDMKKELYSLRMGVLYINVLMFFPLITQTLLAQCSTQVPLLLPSLSWLLYFTVLPPIPELIDSNILLSKYISTVLWIVSHLTHVMSSHLNSVVSVFNEEQLLNLVVLEYTKKWQMEILTDRLLKNLWLFSCFEFKLLYCILLDLCSENSSAELES